jgi:membrane protease YdiL (CAAX protease family)
MLLTWPFGCCDVVFDRAGLPTGRYWVVGPQGPAEAFVMVVKLGVSAFSEELIARAYLITRLADLLGSRGWALVLAAAAFASYHVYLGPTALVSTFLVGLAYGAIYLGVGRIWPLVFGHALYNILLELAAASRT